MSTGYRLCFHIIWMTLQMLVFAYPDPRSLMANSQFTPYVSEFEYASRFHPSKNPECPTGLSGNWKERKESRNRRNFGSSRYQRSPEEDSPVGQEPSIEVRAVLVRCPKSEEDADDVFINRNIYNITAGRSQDILDFHGFDRDEPTRHSEVHDCRRKLIITIKFNNIGKTKTQEEFVVIDHVLDPVTMHKARLLNPFVVKVRQEPVLQLYGLKFQGVVNAEAREEVMNNKQSNYTGCDDTSENPTCGQMIFEDKPIPYSQGFCCSCHPEVNIQRQASIFNETVVSSFSSFFSKDRSIRPFKSPRSVKANFIDHLSETDEINEISSAKKNEDDDVLRSSNESLEKLKNENLQGKFQPMKNNSTLNREANEDESDLKNLKRLTEKNEKMGISVISKSDSSSLISKSSEPSNEKFKDLADGRRNIETKDKNVISEFRRNEKETLSSKPMMNLIDELTKLEEDYKKFRISSKMKGAERKDRVNDKTRLKAGGTNFGDEKYFGQRSNVDNTAKFRPIGSLENELFAKNNYDGRNYVSTSRSTEKLPLLIHKMIYDHSSTLSIDVKLTFVPREKSTIRPNPFFTPNICTKEILPSATTMTRKFSEFSTPAILWQKLASDRVYPSSKKNNVFSKNSYDRDHHFYSTKMTTILNEKFDNDVADLLANVVMSDDTELIPDDLPSNINLSSVEENHETAIFENSITTISKQETETGITSELSTTMHSREKNDFTTSLDGISSHVENLKDSSSSFSSGNHKRNEAIVLSGSLKNQLGNWLTYDESRKYESPDERKNSKQDYDEKIQVGRRHEIAMKRFTSSLNIDEKKHYRHEDETNSTIDDRMPVEIHLGMNYDHESSTGIDDEIFLSKMTDKVEKSSREASLERMNPEEANYISKKKSKRSYLPRSYRSIADDDRFFARDSARQKNIDKRIEREFEEISDVLKDAADGKIIIRENPKSDENFEQDDSTMKKFGLIADKIPKEIEKENNFNSHENSSKVDSEFSQNEQDRFKLRKVNGGSKTGRILHGDSSQPAKEQTQVNASTMIMEEDRTKVTQISKQSVEPISEIPHTTEHQIIIDRFKFTNEFMDIPDNPDKTEPESLTTGITNAAQTPRNPIPVNRFNIANDFRHVPDNDQNRRKENSSNFSKLRKVLQKNRDLSKKDSLMNNSFLNNSSPLFMIENLKKQLRNEAEHYSPISQSPSSADRSNVRDVEEYWQYANEAVEVNTDLTPAEKVEDLITDEETLPPDEKTMTSMPIITNFSSSVTTHPYFHEKSLNVTFVPRFIIENFQRSPKNKFHSIPSKKTNKVLLLIEESLPSSSASLHHVKNKNSQGGRIHRHRYRRHNHTKKRLGKIKRDIDTTMISRFVVKGKTENEDDEHPWYDTTVEPGLTVLNGSKDTTTQVSSTILSKAKKVMENKKPEVTSTGRSKRNLKTLSSRTFQSFYPKSSDFTSMGENEHLIDDIANKVNRNSKRDDAMDYEVNEPKALIFYDYENEGENTEDINADDKRSLDNAVPEEIIGGMEPSEGWKEKMELLKLKKHADVLKEYLNWRHDVVPPENHEMAGYTTMITNEGPEETSHFLTTTILNVLDESILPNTVSNYLTNKEAFPNKVEQQTDADAFTTSSQENIVEQTIFSSTAESSLILMVTNSSKNVDELNTTVKIEMSTGCFVNVNNNNNMTDGKMGYDEENLTGRILPPCGSGFDGQRKLSDKFIPEFSKNIDVHPYRSNGISFSTSSKAISENRGHLSDKFIPEFSKNIDVHPYRSNGISFSTSSKPISDNRGHLSDKFVPEFSKNIDDHPYRSNGVSFSTSSEPISDNRGHLSDKFMPELSKNIDDHPYRSNGVSFSTSSEPISDNREHLSDKFIPELSKNIDDHPYRSNGVSFSTSSKPISDNRGHLTDTDNDLVVISLMEKNRLRNKNIGRNKENGQSTGKIYRIREEVKSDPHHRRQKSKKKKLIRKSNKIDKRYKRVPGRRLMFVSALDDSNDNYENDLRFEEGEENNDLANDGNNDDSNIENDSKKLKITWDELIEKIIHENSSDSWHFGNTTSSWLKDISSDPRSVLKQLHFYDADKYIKKVAKKIVHNSNIHDSKDEKDLYVDKGKVSRQRENSRRHNRVKSHVVLGRKLKQYPDKSMTNLRFKMADSYENGGDRSDQRLNRFDRNENSGSEKDGRDFAISLTGKVHVEGGTDGKLMSIRFDTSPDKPKTNEILQSELNKTSKFDNQTKIDGENLPSTNFLSSLFNIANVPKESEHNSPRDGKNSNYNVFLDQSIRPSNDDKLRPSRENHRQMDEAKQTLKVRKSRSIDSEAAERYFKYRDDRSDDVADSRGIDEKSDIDIYPESSIDDENNSEIDDDSSESESHRINVDGERSLDSPKIRMIKIIPFDVEKSLASLSLLDSSQENQQDTNTDTKIIRMTASQLPKPNDQASERTVKPGKIGPVDFPLREIEDSNPVGEDFPGKSSETCPPQFPDENLDKSKIPNDFPMDRRISTMNPVNLKIIGLISMKKPAVDEPKKLNVNSNSNYEMVPLIHVKIQQQPVDRPSDRNYMVPLYPDDHPQSPRVADCSKIEITSPKNISDSLCTRINGIRDKIENEETLKNPVKPISKMDNGEEPREQITPCPECEKINLQKIPSCSDDKSKKIRPMDETSEDSCHGDRKTPLITSTQDSLDESDTRKKIRMKNMLAILEFMKKINKIMSGDGKTDCTNDDYKDAVIKLERVIVFPNNRSNGISGRPQEPETTTNRVVVIGEGVKHDSSSDSTSSEENLKPSENKEIDDMINNKNEDGKLNETESSYNSSNPHRKVVETNQDQSFLFYGKNDKLGASSMVSEDVTNENRHFNNVQNDETTINSGIVNENVSASDSSVSNSSNTVPSNSDGSSADNETPGVYNSGEESKSTESDVSRNIARKINDQFHRNLRNEGFDNDEEVHYKKVKKRVSDRSTSKRKKVSNDFSSFPMVKRRRSSNRLASHRTRYDLRDGRVAGSNIYRSTLSPYGGQLIRLGGQKVGRFVPVNDNNVREKRKKKRRKKKKRRRKKNKKNRGKNKSKAANKGWWPFGRQLMSLNAKRQVILDSNFDRRQVERANMKKRAGRRIPFSLEQRKRRKVHRANYSHEKKKKIKKNHTHNKGRKKNKKPKTKKKGKKVKKLERNKRQIEPGGTQVRGGQDCMDRRHPSNVNPSKYLDSTHCLRFSDMWYSVYELERPIMEHTVYLQLFEKHSLADGTTHWDDLTQGTMVRMGTFTRQQRDKKPTIVFTYSGAKVESQKRALNLDPARQRLLVPSPVPPSKVSEYPQVQGGSGEYLVVQTNKISKDGNECDKAGVNFAAFTKQEDRCGRPKGSCLKNQPLAYWKHDMEARDSGRRGCYFLSNFASVPTNPIKYNISGTGSREYLGLEYHSSHVSAIDIEVRTDYNAIVRVGSSGRVTEVYIDSTSLEHTVVTVVISNMGLASSPYQPRITDCPTGLPVSWTKAKGIMQVIPPQHDQRVTLDLYGQLLLNGFHCSVEVVNHRGELVAMRRIRVQKMDRCFCVWHCLCACIGSVSGMGCQPMSPEHYHAAGFQGPVPVISTESSILMNAVKDVFMLSALLVLLLLLLGLLKWFVGMFAPTVGRWGLDRLLQGSKIEKYFEQELKCRCVVSDDDGIPVHPDTGQRTVRLCSRKLEFILNLIFFLTYPVAMCCSYFRRSLQSSRQHHCCSDESKMCLINEKSSCPKMICVSTYGDSRNSRLEAEDTKYVMNELKKSQESLENPKATKKKDGRKSDKTLIRKSSHKNKSATDVNARKLVEELLKRRTVFRNLTEPIGGLAVPAGITYSLRGYFLNAENGGYRFITPCPFKQHWLIENNQKKSSKPPEIYPSNLFMCTFRTARDVFESNEISLSPKGICINVQYLEHK